MIVEVFDLFDPSTRHVNFLELVPNWRPPIVEESLDFPEQGFCLLAWDILMSFKLELIYWGSAIIWVPCSGYLKTPMKK